MYIENGNTLVVKSDALHYEKERSGLKCNTVRQEFALFEDLDMAYDTFEADIGYIRVISAANPICSFKRVISDVSYWNDIIIISWGHSDETN